MKLASDPKDVQEFLFKQSSTRQILTGFKTVPTACNLVATDGKRGLLYIGYENKIKVVRCDDQTANEWKFEHELPQTISRVALSCDYEYLSITFHRSTARIYNAGSLTTDNLVLLHEIQLSPTNNDVFAYDLKWNPAVPGMFCTVASDHTIGSFLVKADKKPTVGLVALERIEGLEVLCVAWSPKGKQIVVGCRNGNIVQLKPDLKIARSIAGPSPNVGGVIAILWISNYQFCATYQDLNDRSIKVLIADAPKGEPRGIFTCYDDITYGMPETEGENCFSRYYLDHVSEWGLIIAASSSSTEVAVLGSHDNGSTWEQWQLVDSGRAQLPLIRTTESYPVGMAIDRSSDIRLALGPETTLPHPVPVLHMLGTLGQLVSFHMVYLTPNCPPLCTPPTEIITAVQIQTSRPSLAPSEISFNLNTRATSTPLAKQTEFAAERPKIMPSVTLFKDAAKPPPPAPAPVLQVQLKIPKPRAEKIETLPARVEQRLSPVKEVTSQPEKTAVDESLCLRAYSEEQMLFEKELKSKLEQQVWKCGTEKEQQMLVTQSAIIDEFLRDLRETTNSLSSDVAALKALLLQSFAWLEETRSKNSANATDNPRDHGDRNKIKELQRSFFNIQSQMIQATKALDIEWTDYESRGRSKIEVPRLEFIYQSLKSHSEIIAKEKSVLEQHLKKWKSLTRGNKVPSLNKSMSKLNISSSLSTSRKHSDNGAIELRCKAIANNTRNFTLDKQLRLRDLLIETKPRVIKAITPSPVQDRLEATLSSLATANPVSNISKSRSERVLGNDQNIVNNTLQPNPLTSLNNIVTKFGPLDQTINFGPPESKPQEQSVPSILGEAFSKGANKLPMSSDNFSIATSPYFQNSPSKPLAPMSAGLTITRNEPQSVKSSFGSKITYPGIPDSTTVQEVRFEPTSSTLNSASSGQSAIAAKSTGNEVTPPTSNLQSFSFASKPDTPAFSFALKDPTTTNQTTTQASTELSGLFDLGLASIGSQPFGQVKPAASPVTTSSPPATSPPAPRSEPALPPSSNIFGNTLANLPITGSTLDKTPSSSSSIFGGGTTSTTPVSVFGRGTSGLTSPLFGGSPAVGGSSLAASFNARQAILASAQTASTPPSMFGNSGATNLTKPTTGTSGTTSFGELPLNFSSSGSGGIASNLSTAVGVAFDFGAAAVDTCPPDYDTDTEPVPTASVFNQAAAAASSTSPNLVKTVTTANLFGGASTTPSSATVFGNVSSSPASTIPTSSAVFGNVSSSPAFTVPTSGTVFGNVSSKPSSTIPTSSAVFGNVSSSPASTVPTSGTVFGNVSSNPASTIPTSSSVFGNVSASTVPTSGTVFGNVSASLQSSLPVTSSPFGNNPTSPPSTTPASVSVFGKVSSSPASTIPTSSLFGNDPSSPASTIPTSGTVFGNISSNIQSTLSTSSSPFGNNPASPPSTTPASVSVFGKVSSSPASTIPTSSLFGNDPSSPASTAPVSGSVFGNVSSNPASTLPANSSPFGNNPASPPSTTPVSGSVFGNVSSNPVSTLPAGSSLFGNDPSSPPSTTSTSVFGNVSANRASTIFGGGTASPAATSGFEGNSASNAPFGTSNTIFGGGVQKSPTSIFGGGTATPMSAFGGAATQPTSPTGTGSPQVASVFGQSPSFGTKPVFGGQAPVFGAAKPGFSNPFGNSTFGAAATSTGFNSAPAMGGPPPSGTASMQKPFGNVENSSTFESLAGQNGSDLTFGSFAQKTPEPSKAPAFSGGGSFSSWR